MNNSRPSNENLESEEKLKVDLAENNKNNLKNMSFMSKHLAAAAGFNVETPIVNAIIGNLTGTIPVRKSETEMIKCEICDCELSSDVVLNFHINGSKHKKRLRALEIMAQLKDGNDKGVHLGNGENPSSLGCEICSVTVNSPQQLEIHLSGAKHKKKASKATVVPVSQTVTLHEDSGPIENTDNPSPPAPKKKKKDEPTLIPCDICNLFLNSQIQYDQHVLSKKHQSKTENSQQTKMPEKEKFPQMKSQFPVNDMNQKGTHRFAPIYNGLFSHPNLIAKSPLLNNCKNVENNFNALRLPKPPNFYQKRF